jgi:hypothetical protein
MVGQVFNMPPQPPVLEHTRTVSAGVITFGVEYRDVEPESLTETYAANADHLAELEARSPEGGFSDEGVSIHVCATDDGHEYVRFDIFEEEPHYHYIHNTPPDAEIVNNVIAFDAVAHGDMLPWAIERLRTRLPAMLTAAGGERLAARLDPALVDPAIDEVDAMARRARDAFRAASSP